MKPPGFQKTSGPSPFASRSELWCIHLAKHKAQNISKVGGYMYRNIELLLYLYIYIYIDIQS